MEAEEQAEASQRCLAVANALENLSPASSLSDLSIHDESTLRDDRTVELVPSDPAALSLVQCILATKSSTAQGQAGDTNASPSNVAGAATGAQDPASVSPRPSFLNLVPGHLQGDMRPTRPDALQVYAHKFGVEDVGYQSNVVRHGLSTWGPPLLSMSDPVKHEYVPQRDGVADAWLAWTGQVAVPQAGQSTVSQGPQAGVPGREVAPTSHTPLHSSAEDGIAASSTTSSPRHSPEGSPVASMGEVSDDDGRSGSTTLSGTSTSSGEPSLWGDTPDLPVDLPYGLPWRGMRAVTATSFDPVFGGPPPEQPIYRPTSHRLSRARRAVTTTDGGDPGATLDSLLRDVPGMLPNAPVAGYHPLSKGLGGARRGGHSSLSAAGSKPSQQAGAADPKTRGAAVTLGRGNGVDGGQNRTSGVRDTPAPWRQPVVPATTPVRHVVSARARRVSLGATAQRDERTATDGLATSDEVGGTRGDPAHETDEDLVAIGRPMSATRPPRSSSSLSTSQRPHPGPSPPPPQSPSATPALTTPLHATSDLFSQLGVIPRPHSSVSQERRASSALAVASVASVRSPSMSPTGSLPLAARQPSPRFMRLSPHPTPLPPRGAESASGMAAGKSGSRRSTSRHRHSALGTQSQHPGTFTPPSHQRSAWLHEYTSGSDRRGARRHSASHHMAGHQRPHSAAATSQRWQRSWWRPGTSTAPSAAAARQNARYPALYEVEFSQHSEGSDSGAQSSQTSPRHERQPRRKDASRSPRQSLGTELERSATPRCSSASSLSSSTSSSTPLELSSDSDDGGAVVRASKHGHGAARTSKIATSTLESDGGGRRENVAVGLGGIRGSHMSPVDRHQHSQARPIVVAGQPVVAVTKGNAPAARGTGTTPRKGKDGAVSVLSTTSEFTVTSSRRRQTCRAGKPLTPEAPPSRGATAGSFLRPPSTAAPRGDTRLQSRVTVEMVDEGAPLRASMLPRRAMTSTAVSRTGNWRHRRQRATPLRHTGDTPPGNRDAHRNQPVQRATTAVPPVGRDDISSWAGLGDDDEDTRRRSENPFPPASQWVAAHSFTSMAPFAHGSRSQRSSRVRRRRSRAFRARRKRSKHRKRRASMPTTLTSTSNASATNAHDGTPHGVTAAGQKGADPVAQAGAAAGAVCAKPVAAPRPSVLPQSPSENPARSCSVGFTESLTTVAGTASVPASDQSSTVDHPTLTPSRPPTAPPRYTLRHHMGHAHGREWHRKRSTSDRIPETTPPVTCESAGDPLLGERAPRSTSVVPVAPMEVGDSDVVWHRSLAASSLSNASWSDPRQPPTSTRARRSARAQTGHAQTMAAGSVSALSTAKQGVAAQPPAATHAPPNEHTRRAGPKCPPSQAVPPDRSTPRRRTVRHTSPRLLRYREALQSPPGSTHTIVPTNPALVAVPAVKTLRVGTAAGSPSPRPRRSCLTGQTTTLSHASRTDGFQSAQASSHTQRKREVPRSPRHAGPRAARSSSVSASKERYDAARGAAVSALAIVAAAPTATPSSIGSPAAGAARTPTPVLEGGASAARSFWSARHPDGAGTLPSGSGGAVPRGHDDGDKPGRHSRVSSGSRGAVSRMLTGRTARIQAGTTTTRSVLTDGLIRLPGISSPQPLRTGARRHTVAHRTPVFNVPPQMQQAKPSPSSRFTRAFKKSAPTILADMAAQLAAADADTPGAASVAQRIRHRDMDGNFVHAQRPAARMSLADCAASGQQRENQDGPDVARTALEPPTVPLDSTVCPHRDELNVDEVATGSTFQRMRQVLLSAIASRTNPPEPSGPTATAITLTGSHDTAQNTTGVALFAVLPLKDSRGPAAGVAVSTPATALAHDPLPPQSTASTSGVDPVRRQRPHRPATGARILGAAGREPFRAVAERGTSGTSGTSGTKRGRGTTRHGTPVRAASVGRWTLQGDGVDMLFIGNSTT